MFTTWPNLEKLSSGAIGPMSHQTMLAGQNGGGGSVGPDNSKVRLVDASGRDVDLGSDAGHVHVLADLSAQT